LNILGFENYTQYSIHNFERRKFFRTYLSHYSKNICFLYSNFFLALYENEKKIRTKKEYWSYIKHIILKVLQIKADNVWDDFIYETDARFTGVWPKNTKWDTYFNESEFMNFITEIEDLVKEKIFTNNDSSYLNSKGFNRVITDRGVLISYFMLKKLFEGTPNTSTIDTPIPPNIFFPNDIFIIYSNIIEHTLMNETSLPLLAFVQSSTSETGSHKHEVKNIQYRKCTKHNNVNTIRFYISSLLGKPIKFLRGPVILELHFKRIPENI
jgi:hypothetical protein